MRGIPGDKNRVLDEKKNLKDRAFAKGQRGSEEPIGSLALSNRNSESLANLTRGEPVLVTGTVGHAGRAQTSGAGNGARGV